MNERSRHSGQVDELDVEGPWLSQNAFCHAPPTGVTAPAFSYLRGIEIENEGLVDQNSASWNRVTSWLASVDALKLSA